MSSSSISVPTGAPSGKLPLGLIVRSVLILALLAVAIASVLALRSGINEQSMGHYTVFLSAGSNPSEVAAEHASANDFEVERSVTDASSPAYMASMSQPSAAAVVAEAEVAYIELDSTRATKTSWYETAWIKLQTATA